MGKTEARAGSAQPQVVTAEVVTLLKQHADLFAFSLRGRLAIVVRERYPRDYASWPLLQNFRFACSYTDTYVLVQMVPTAGLTIGPEGGIECVEGRVPPLPDSEDLRVWQTWLDDGRKFLRLAEDAGLYAVPLGLVREEIVASLDHSGRPPSSVLDGQVENNIAHQRRFLRIDSAAPEEWRGRPMSFAEAAPLFGLTGNALRKRCEGATESGSPYYPLRPRGPARLPNGKLREDAVRYVAEQVGRSKEVALKAIEERKRAITWGRTNNPISPGALEREGMRRLDQQP